MNSDPLNTDSASTDTTPQLNSPQATTSTAATSQEAVEHVQTASTELSIVMQPDATEPMPAHETEQPALMPVAPAIVEILAPITSTEAEVALPVADEKIATVEVPVPPTVATLEPAAPKPLTSSAIIIGGSPIILPNGKAGELYSFQFTSDVADLSTCTSVRVLGPDGLGLTFNQETQTLAGQPAQAGEYEMKLSYRPAESKPDEPTHVRTLRWYVNPDPRSLDGT